MREIKNSRRRLLQNKLAALYQRCKSGLEIMMSVVMYDLSKRPVSSTARTKSKDKSKDTKFLP